jgi:uncharacterized protein with beta-barrel porin domain
LLRLVRSCGALDLCCALRRLRCAAGRVEGGYRFGMPFYGVTPYAAVQAQNVFTPGYTETATAGTGAMAQAFASKSATSTRTELGSWMDTQVSTVLFRGRAASGR